MTVPAHRRTFWIAASLVLAACWNGTDVPSKPVESAPVDTVYKIVITAVGHLLVGDTYALRAPGLMSRSQPIALSVNWSSSAQQRARSGRGRATLCRRVRRAVGRVGFCRGDVVERRSECCTGGCARSFSNADRICAPRIRATCWHATRRASRSCSTRRLSRASPTTLPRGSAMLPSPAAPAKSFWRMTRACTRKRRGAGRCPSRDRHVRPAVARRRRRVEPRASSVGNGQSRLGVEPDVGPNTVTA